MSRSITFRLPDGEAKRLFEELERRGVTLTEAMREAEAMWVAAGKLTPSKIVLDPRPMAGLKRPDTDAALLRHEAMWKAIHADVPILQRKTFNPQPKKGKK